MYRYILGKQYHIVKTNYLCAKFKASTIAVKIMQWTVVHLLFHRFSW